MRMEIPAGVCLLVADWGIGDHYIVGALAEAVRRQYGLRVWLATKPHLSFVGGLYPAVEHTLPWPADEDATALSAWQPEGGRMFYAHFPKLELMRAVGYNGFHFLDAYRCRLGLASAANLTRPRPPSAAEVAAAQGVLIEHGCPPGRTVVLSIEARTTPTDGVTPEFWLRVARSLEAAGLQALVNAAPGGAVPPELKAACLSLPHFRAVVMAAGFFCSVRSGLSDLVCDLRCPQVVVYPDVRYWAGGLREGTTFERFGLTKAPHERVVRAGEDEAVAAEIAAYFAARLPRTAPLAGVS